MNELDFIGSSLPLLIGIKFNLFVGNARDSGVLGVIFDIVKAIGSKDIQAILIRLVVEECIVVEVSGRDSQTLLLDRVPGSLLELIVGNARLVSDLLGG